MGRGGRRSERSERAAAARHYASSVAAFVFAPGNERAGCPNPGTLRR